MSTSTARAAFALALAAATTAAFAGEEPTIVSNRRVAVASLDPSAAYGTAGPGKLGDFAADMLTTELVNMGANVVERSQLKKMESEGEMGTIGIVDAESAATLGKKMGAQWMVVGRITEFGMKKSGTSVPGIGRIGGDEARVKIDARIVDARTGLILAAASGAGSEKTGGFRLSGGALNLPSFLRGADFDSSEWQDGQFGKATRKAIRGLAVEFAKKWAAAEARCKLNGDAPAADRASEPAPARAASYASLKGLTAVVVMPETIFLRPNVPDPAAETEVIRQLLRAGVRVVDDARAKQLRADRKVMAMLRGETNEAKLEELRTMFGADILIVGEGIAERNGTQVAELGSVFSRARVEMRAIRMDTGEILAADGSHAPGRDMSEALAGKSALQNAAKELAPKFIAMMAEVAGHNGTAANPGTVRIEIEVAGWASLGAAQGFVNDLKGLSGVKSATRSNFKGGILFATLEVQAAKMDDLAASLETAATMKRYRLSVQTATKAKIEAKTGR